MNKLKLIGSVCALILLAFFLVKVNEKQDEIQQLKDYNERLVDDNLELNSKIYPTKLYKAVEVTQEEWNKLQCGSSSTFVLGTKKGNICVNLEQK